MSRKPRLLLALLLGAAALAASLLLGRAAWERHEQRQWDEYAAAPIAAPQPMIVAAPAGATMQQVAAGLAAAGAVADERRFSGLARRLGQDRSIKAGQYRLEPGMSHAAALEKMVAGEVEQARFAIVEGLRFADVLARLAAEPAFTRTLSDLRPAAAWQELGFEAEGGYEGMLYPDTYLLDYGTSDRELLGQAHRRMAALLDEQWRRRAAELPLASPHEALVLASIIEKETGVAGERALIASVFHNRLRLGMRLQSDPTVIYGIEDFDGNLTRAHLQQDHPHNTYTRKGLPPTPIAIPSVAAVEAALQPLDSDYLYFVADGSGGHHFSRTLREHNNAVNRYQRNRR
ncbi:MAG: endolytic transglycosylase MltG [Betaproteobacteria bacterium AqS2]|uniref:Endolytic murein transglycosylase n=1 Tax=Candidatus Amphirhobacter heronislandensis TaxID=1732024 RepID=A0A930UCS9_9GAMM|nr:endolytic transglycosylase MltG [Betaproteobacteria bacterium AqS2]